MNNNQAITPFAFQGFQVRTVKIDGEPLFFAVDVCRVLDLGNVTQALTRLDADESTLISNEGRIKLGQAYARNNSVLVQ